MVTYRIYIADLHMANVIYLLDNMLHTSSEYVPLGKTTLNGKSGIRMVVRHRNEDIDDATLAYSMGFAQHISAEDMVNLLVGNFDPEETNDES